MSFAIGRTTECDVSGVTLKRRYSLFLFGRDDAPRQRHDHLEELIFVYEEEHFSRQEQLDVVVLCGDDALQVEDIRSVALEVRQCPRSDGVQTRELYCFILRE